MDLFLLYYVQDFFFALHMIYDIWSQNDWPEK